MNIQGAAKNVGNWVKSHPALAGAVVFLVVVATWYITRPKVSVAAQSQDLSGGISYVVGGGDVGASMQMQAINAQTAIAKDKITADKETTAAMIAAQEKLKSMELNNSYNANKMGYDYASAQLGTQEKISTLQLTNQDKQATAGLELTKFLANLQFSPQTYANAEIEAMYAQAGRTATGADKAYWGGQYVTNPGASTALVAELVKDAAGGGNNSYGAAQSVQSMYAAKGLTATAADISYWSTHNNMAAALAYELNK